MAIIFSPSFPEVGVQFPDLLSAYEHLSIIVILLGNYLRVICSHDAFILKVFSGHFPKSRASTPPPTYTGNHKSCGLGDEYNGSVPRPDPKLAAECSLFAFVCNSCNSF